MFNQTLTGPQNSGDNTIIVARAGRTGEQLVSELQGRYYEQCYRGNLFMAHAIVTAPVIYTTAAGTGGPLIWNNNSAINVVLLAVTFGVSTVSTVGAALGITGNSGQTAAPTTTTAIDSNRNLKIGGALPMSTAYRVGTVASAGNFFLPFGELHTGALTTNTGQINVFDIGGAVIIPYNCWASVAASATASTTVASIGFIYTEVPA